MKYIFGMLIVMMLVFSFPMAAFAEESDDGEAKAEKSDDADTETDYWNKFTMAPKLGWIHFIDMEDEYYSPPDHHGMRVQFDLSFGGSGGGFDLGFIYNYQDVDPDNDVVWHALGLTLGWVYRFHFDRVYPFIGISTDIQWILGDGIDGGMELYGRIPIGVNYYVLESLGVFLEFGVGYGTSVANYSLYDWKWGHGVVLDLLAGVRFP